MDGVYLRERHRTSRALVLVNQQQLIVLQDESQRVNHREVGVVVEDQTYGSLVIKGQANLFKDASIVA
ncbi:hypothetical protein DM784_13155 [Vibrio furnissii]|nr:hypothetical protein DM784_13155 [Vibrio furnissii]